MEINAERFYMIEYKVGDTYPTWFSGNKEGLSTILEIKPYTGLYKEAFSKVLKLTAPNTKKNWLEMAVA